MKVLVTGGAGFIGSNFIRYWIKHYPADQIVNIDNYSYAGNKNNIADFSKNPNVSNFALDICGRSKISRLMKGVDTVFHFAAETHVDRSILDSTLFLKTNILGTQSLLECALENNVSKFIYISTDEVYGSIDHGTFSETDPFLPNSPYAASKASADLLCRSYWKTYGLPVLVTRCCNNYGPYQYPEKVIPLFITNLLEDKTIPIYGKGLNVREWIYVMDHCSAIDSVCRKGTVGESYNIGSGITIENHKLALELLAILNKPRSCIDYVQDRIGHDFRYALNSTKIRNLGWKPQSDFKTSLQETVRWYQNHDSWWKKIKEQNNYKNYLKRNYAKAK